MQCYGLLGWEDGLSEALSASTCNRPLVLPDSGADATDEVGGLVVAAAAELKSLAPLFSLI